MPMIQPLDILDRQRRRQTVKMSWISVDDYLPEPGQVTLFRLKDSSNLKEHISYPAILGHAIAYGVGKFDSAIEITQPEEWFRSHDAIYEGDKSYYWLCTLDRAAFCFHQNEVSHWAAIIDPLTGDDVKVEDPKFNPTDFGIQGEDE